MTRAAAALEGRRHLVLLRHAWAGHRSRWSGDDRDRPLDPHGSAQAEALVTHLPRALGVGFDQAVLLSSPLTRCVTTLAPMAGDLDLHLGTDERLAEVDVPLTSDDGWPAAAYHGARALAAVADAPRDDGPLVVCSHGEVLPALLAALAGDLGLPVPPTVDLSSKALAKAAAWHVDLAAAAVRELPPPPVPSRP